MASSASGSAGGKSEYTATFNGEVIARAKQSECESVDGNVYFPPDALNTKFFSSSGHSTVCGWKGTASYQNVKVGDKSADNVVWCYKTPKSAAQNIKGFYAFYTSKGVSVGSA